MASSTVSSLNDTIDGGPSGGSGSALLDPSVLQKKLIKIDKCIAAEEKTLATIQDEFIKLGISHDKSPAKHQTKMRELEQANDKASRHIEEYKTKKRKYESALKALEEQQRLEALKARKETKEATKGNVVTEAVKTGTRIFLGRSTRNGDTGSGRSKDSRGSKDESPAPVGGEGQTLDVSISSVESDSQESHKRQRRLEEITEVVDGKLEPLAGDMHDITEKLDQLFKIIGENKAELSEERKANNAVFDDILRRCGYVEEQIHDLIELHQKETAETKTYLVDTQDKTNYVFHEWVRDMKDEITSLNTRIAKIEHRQKEDESLARTEAAKSVMGEMAFKMVDCVLLFGQLVIAVVGAISHFFQMTAENSTRLVIFLVCIIALLVIFQFRAQIPFSKEIASLGYAASHRVNSWIHFATFSIFGVNWIVPADKE